MRRGRLEKRALGLAGRDQPAGLGQAFERQEERRSENLSALHGYPFTQSTCLSVCTTSTRSDWFAITSSIFL